MAEGSKILGQNVVPVPLCPPQIPHEITVCQIIIRLSNLSTVTIYSICPHS